MFVAQFLEMSKRWVTHLTCHISVPDDSDHICAEGTSRLVWREVGLMIHSVEDVDLYV